MAAVLSLAPVVAHAGAQTESDGISRESYQITSVRWDPLLKRSWVVAIPRHQPSGSPMRLLPIQGDTPATEASVFPVVHAGDVVQIGWQDTVSRIQMTGIAEENGVAGRRIRVHLLRQMTFALGSEAGWAAPPRTLLATVRGPGEVEVVR